MAITTYDGAIAGFQAPRFIAKAITAAPVAGRVQSLWALAGSPGAGSYDTTLNGVTLTAPVNGQIPFSNPASGNAYLARFSAQCTQASQLLLLDRIWHNGGYTISSTSAQNTTSPTWPARDANGSTNGEGILLAVEVSAATGAGTPTITVSYTNSAGTAGRTGTNIVSTTASAVIGATYLIGLQAGDTGVRSVQSLTLSATWTSGTINLVAFRPLLSLELLANTPNAVDPLTGGMPILYDGTVPYLAFVATTTTTSNVTGSLVYTHG